MVNDMKQQISECMDGELDMHGAARLLERVAVSAEYRADWLVYHMIGDGMRDAPDLSPAPGPRPRSRAAGGALDTPEVKPRHSSRDRLRIGFFSL